MIIILTTLRRVSDLISETKLDSLNNSFTAKLDEANTFLSNVLHSDYNLFESEDNEVSSPHKRSHGRALLVEDFFILTRMYPFPGSILNYIAQILDIDLDNSVTALALQIDKD